MEPDLAEITIFAYPTCIQPPPRLGLSPSEYCHDIRYEKLELFGYSAVKKKLKIRLLAFIECTNYERDRRTDGQTDGHRVTA